jgi:hypothetical protein
VSAASEFGERSRVTRSVHDAWRSLVLTVLFLLGCSLVMTSNAGLAAADIGVLGPPPADPEVRQALTDFYTAGHPLGSIVDVRFDGPILVGVPTEHANPPPRPWCVRCGYPEQGASLMYPVKAEVTVTATQGLESSALAPGTTAQTRATYNGTTCPKADPSQYCREYFFFRDGQGNWQIA